MSSREALTAAKWWAEAIDAPRFDNGDKSPTGDMTSMMAQLLVKPIEPSTADKFAALLAQAIDREVSACGSAYLRVDYGPDDLLFDVAQASGVNLGNFPWKTTMSVLPGCVRVSAGYRAPMVDLALAEASA